EETSSILWYEELYLMFLAAPEVIDLEIAEIGLREHAAGRQEKRCLWWNLVKNSSRYQASAHRALLEQVRVKFGLSENWDAEYRQDSAGGRHRFLMLNLAEVRRLAGEGMSIGAHTLTHPLLSQLPPESAWREISESRLGLERALGGPVWALAYPFGDLGSITRREVELAERAGFTCAFLNGGGGLGAPTPRFAMPRVHVTATTTLAEFEAHVSGLY